MNSGNNEPGTTANSDERIEPEKEVVEKKDLVINFNIQVSREEIEKNFEETAQKYASEIKVPGFRRGKVPIDVVKNRFKEAIYIEVREKLINKHVYEKMEKEKLRIVSSPVVEKIDHEEGNDLSADIRVEIFPEVNLPDLETVELEIPAKDLKLKDYDEQEQIEAILKSRKKMMPVTDREIKENDFVHLTYQSKIIETRRMTPMKDVQFWVSKDEDFEILDLYNDLIGKKLKDKVTIRRKYAEDYKKKIWAGKEIEHYIEIKGIFEPVKPEFNQEFLKSMGFEDEASFKKQMKEEYEQIEQNHRQDKIVQYIIDKLNEVVEFPVPESLVEAEAAAILGSVAPQIRFNDENQAKEYWAPFKSKAEKTVKFSLIIDAVKEKYNVEVTSDEMEKEYQNIAARNRISLPEVKRYYRNPQNSRDLKDSLMRTKVMKFIKDKVKIKEV